MLSSTQRGGLIMRIKKVKVIWPKFKYWFKSNLGGTSVRVDFCVFHPLFTTIMLGIGMLTLKAIQEGRTWDSVYFTVLFFITSCFLNHIGYVGGYRDAYREAYKDFRNHYNLNRSRCGERRRTSRSSDSLRFTIREHGEIG